MKKQEDKQNKAEAWCTDCGYLIIAPELCTTEYYEKVICYREQRFFGSKVGSIIGKTTYKASEVEPFLMTPHQCSFYTKKIPGLTHEQLLEHELYKVPAQKTAAASLRIAIISLAIAASSLVFTVVYNLWLRSPEAKPGIAQQTPAVMVLPAAQIVPSPALNSRK